MPYRCVNDIFNYCSGEPEFYQKQVETYVTPSQDYKEGIQKDVIPVCKLNPTTCGKHQTLAEQVGKDRLALLKPKFKVTKSGRVVPIKEKKND